MSDRAFSLYQSVLVPSTAHAMLEERVRAARDMNEWILYTTGLGRDNAWEARLLERRPLDAWLRKSLLTVARNFRGVSQTLRVEEGKFDVPILDNRGVWSAMPVCVSFFFTRCLSPPPLITPASARVEGEGDALRVVCVIDRLHLKMLDETPDATWTVAAVLAMRFPPACGYLSENP